MKMVFLRGSVPPPNEHPEKLLYDNIENCEDMWTQLFYYLLEELDAEGELVYQTMGSQRREFATGRFRDKWVGPVGEYTPPFKPDVIICRGGFDYYDDFLMRHLDAKKVYYGAGDRYYPQGDFKHYDLFLVDTPKQMKKVRERTAAAVSLFVKPAATLFKPKKVPKKFDVCFMANAAQGAFKGHREFLQQMAGSDISILNLGNTRGEYVELAKELGVDITWGGWSLRKHLPKEISKCHVGVACSLRRDSCPRVIPEYLACGLPVIVTDTVDFWREKYITDETGLVVPMSKLADTIHSTLWGFNEFAPKKYYDEHLSMKCAVKTLAKLIGKI